MAQHFKALIHLLRPKHWVKNGFVFLPAIFANRWQEPEVMWPTVLSCGVFCLAAGLVYILNDWWDMADDQQHPTKRLRPLASGTVSLSEAGLLALVLATTLGAILWRWQDLILYITIYLALNLAYTFGLKRLAIVDVAIIGLGFVLRIVAGGAMGDVFVSEWLITIVFLLCTGLALAKRRHDLALLQAQGMPAEQTQKYTLPFLDLALTVLMSITLLAYIIYSLSPEVAARLGTNKLYITSFFVLLGMLRYLQLTLSNTQSGSPVELLWRDRTLQVVIVLWLLSYFLLVHF